MAYLVDGVSSEDRDSFAHATAARALWMPARIVNRMYGQSGVCPSEAVNWVSSLSYSS